MILLYYKLFTETSFSFKFVSEPVSDNLIFVDKQILTLLISVYKTQNLLTRSLTDHEISKTTERIAMKTGIHLPLSP